MGRADALLRRDEVRSAIIFCNRKTTVRELATSLKRGHLKVGQIQGDMEQSERISELARFKADEINILIASDVAARGLDIKDVSHVFNYDVPWHPDDYVHRIGRTGRAGKTGTAITLVTSADEESIDNIQKLTGTKLAPMDESGAAGPAREEREPPAREEGGERRERAETPRRGRREKRETKETPRDEKRQPPRRERDPAREAEPADEGWNGPVPSFLDRGFGG